MRAVLRQALKERRFRSAFEKAVALAWLRARTDDRLKAVVAELEEVLRAP